MVPSSPLGAPWRHVLFLGGIVTPETLSWLLRAPGNF